MNFPDDDPFFSEISNFIETIEQSGDEEEEAQILSSYEGMAPLLSFSESHF